MPTFSPSLQLIGVSKSYAGVPVVRAVDLEIEAGSTTVLIGPSGCGKSTLLRLMMGLIRPDAGSVSLGNQRLDRESTQSLRRQMGYVIQDGGLFPHLTARQNVSLMARYLGWAAAKIEDRIAELTSLTKFPKEGLDRYPVQLSGGQRQRVSLMRALMLEPAVLLLDEPLGALDPIIRSQLQTDLRDIFQRLDKTVVLVTHDLGEAVYFGDRIVLLREGEIVQQGSPQELITSPASRFASEFVNAQRSPLEALGGTAASGGQGSPPVEEPG